MTSDPTTDPLAFELPASGKSKEWAGGESRGLNFAATFVAKCRDLMKERQAHDDTKRKLNGVVRNLIAAIDSCEAVLQEADAKAAAAQAAADAPEASAAPVSPPSPDAQLDRIAVGVVRSVRRAMAELLAQLGIEQVDLIGKTFTTVEVGGIKLEDPFEILEGKPLGGSSIMAAPVVAVFQALWVRRDGKQVKIVRKGGVGV